MTLERRRFVRTADASLSLTARFGEEKVSPSRGVDHDVVVDDRPLPGGNVLMKLATFLTVVGAGVLAVSACSSDSDGGSTGGTSGAGGAGATGGAGGSGATATGGTGATATGGTGATGTGGSGATGTGGTGGGADCNPQLQGQSCTVLQTTDPAQNACLQGDCCDEATACLANAECAGIIYCGSVCLQGGGTPQSCGTQCAACATSQAPADLYNAINTCMTACVGGGTGGSAGAAGAAGSPGDGG